MIKHCITLPVVNIFLKPYYKSATEKKNIPQGKVSELSGNRSYSNPISPTSNRSWGKIMEAAL